MSASGRIVGFMSIAATEATRASVENGPIKSLHEGLGALQCDLAGLQDEIRCRQHDDAAILKSLAEIAATSSRIAADLVSPLAFEQLHVALREEKGRPAGAS